MAEINLPLTRKEADVLMERLERASTKREYDGSGALTTLALDLLPIADRLRGILAERTRAALRDPGTRKLDSAA